MFGAPSDKQVLIQGISRYIPPQILEYLGEVGKNPRMARLRDTGILATSVAKQLVKDKAEVLLQGKGSRDVFSLLGRSSFSTPRSDLDHLIQHSQSQYGFRCKGEVNGRRTVCSDAVGPLHLL